MCTDKDYGEEEFEYEDMFEYLGNRYGVSWDIIADDYADRAGDMNNER